MYKKFVTIVTLAIIVICLCGITASAEDGLSIQGSVLKDCAGEVYSIKRALSNCYTEWADYIGDDWDEIDFDMAFKIHYMSMKDTIEAYYYHGNFGDNILDDYYWVVPSYTSGGEVQVAKNDNSATGWSVRRGTHCITDIEANYPGTEFNIVAIYDNILNTHPDYDRESFRFVHARDMDIHLMYFTDDSVEYLIPYFDSADYDWLENAKVYTAEEYIKILENNTETPDYSSSNELHDGYQSIYLEYILIGTLIVLAIGVTAVIIARSRHEADNKEEKETEKDTENNNGNE